LGNLAISDGAIFNTLAGKNKTTARQTSGTAKVSVVLPANSIEGEVIKFGANPTVYLVRSDGLYPFDSFISYSAYVQSTGIKLKILTANPRRFTLKLALAKDVLAQGTPQLGSTGKVLGASTGLPDGSLIQLGQTIYVLSDRVKVPFASLDVFKALGYSLQNVIKLTTTTYPTAQGYQINSAAQTHPAGSWITSNNIIYYVRDTGIIIVPDHQTFLSNGGQDQMLLPANQADQTGISTRLEQVPMSAWDARVHN
jgi:hypothetical protein